MTNSAARAAERVGPAFSVDGMLLARQKTRRAIKGISALIKPGMVEEDAVDLARKTLIESGLVLSWHPTRVRFGSNTIKPMKVSSVPGVVFQENDIFFLDIAPRVDAWEGDGGASFVVGSHADQPPQEGMRLWAGTVALITRTPQLLSNTMPKSDDAKSWLVKTEEDGWKNFDARNWVCQTWAYDAHDIGTTPGLNGDYHQALRSIRARTLILAGVGDLLNPEAEAVEAARYIHGAQFETIEPRWPSGHFSAAGLTQPEVDFQNQAIGAFLTKVYASRGANDVRQAAAGAQ